MNEAAKNPITKYENVMYALHFYAATHQDDLRKRMQDAIDDGLPIFVTEFGICDASGNGAINKEQANKCTSKTGGITVTFSLDKSFF